MNTTQVPTEWLEELHEINYNLIKHTINEHGTDGRDEFMLYLGKLQGHIKASKYFQPQPDSNQNLYKHCVRLLRDLADFQNGAPLEQHKIEYEQTMHEVWAFLGDYENGCLKTQPDSVDLVDPEEFLKWWSLEDVDYKFYKSTWHKHGTNGLEPCPFSEVLEAFKKSKG